MGRWSNFRASSTRSNARLESKTRSRPAYCPKASPRFIFALASTSATSSSTRTTFTATASMSRRGWNRSPRPVGFASPRSCTKASAIGSAPRSGIADRFKSRTSIGRSRSGNGGQATPTLRRPLRLPCAKPRTRDHRSPYCPSTICRAIHRRNTSATASPKTLSLTSPRSPASW
jgi:hypothetical protein